MERAQLVEAEWADGQVFTEEHAWGIRVPFQNWQVMICSLGVEFKLPSLQPNGSVRGAELRPL